MLRWQAIPGIAVETRYHGPTNARGSRISGRDVCRRVSLPWDYALNVADNHARVAQKICDQRNAELGATATKRWTIAGYAESPSAKTSYVFFLTYSA